MLCPVRKLSELVAIEERGTRQKLGELVSSDDDPLFFHCLDKLGHCTSRQLDLKDRIRHSFLHGGGENLVVRLAPGPAVCP